MPPIFAPLIFATLTQTTTYIFGVSKKTRKNPLKNGKNGTKTKLTNVKTSLWDTKNMQVIETIASVLTVMGGWEAARYFISRKTNRRKEEAEAETAEFGVLRETVEFLQSQLREKEQRFAEQTELVRKLNTEILELTKQRAKLELDLQRHRCVVKGCASRDPQNGF